MRTMSSTECSEGNVKSNGHDFRYNEHIGLENGGIVHDDLNSVNNEVINKTHIELGENIKPVGFNIPDLRHDRKSGLVECMASAANDVDVYEHLELNNFAVMNCTPRELIENIKPSNFNIDDQFGRSAKMKREKSQSDSIEREKKRVKFNTKLNEPTEKGKTAKYTLSRPAKHKHVGLLKKKDSDVDNKSAEHEPKSILKKRNININIGTCSLGTLNKNTKRSRSTHSSTSIHNLDQTDKDLINLKENSEINQSSKDNNALLKHSIESNQTETPNIERENISMKNSDLSKQVTENALRETEVVNHLSESEGTKPNSTEAKNIHNQNTELNERQFEIPATNKVINHNITQSRNGNNQTTEGKFETNPIKIRRRLSVIENKQTTESKLEINTIRKRRLPVTVARESSIIPRIVTKKERIGCFSLKRNLSNATDRGTNPPKEGTDKEPLRKCLKISNDASPINKCAKEHLLLETKRDTPKERRVSSTTSEFSRDSRRSADDLHILKEQNRSLEKKIKEVNDRERDLMCQHRSLKAKYELEHSRVVRESKKEAAILLSKLKSKEQMLSNLEKGIQKENPPTRRAFSTDSSLRSYSLPRPSLTRSVSAAAAIGRRKQQSQHPHPQPSLQGTKYPQPHANSSKDEWSGRLATTRKPRTEVLVKGSSTQKRYVTKLQLLTKQIEEQKNKIKDLEGKLQEKTEEDTPSVATIPAIYKGDSRESKDVCESRVNGVGVPSQSATLQSDVVPQEELVLSKGFDDPIDTIDTTDTMDRFIDGRCRSMDCFGIEAQKYSIDLNSMRYSSLVSLHDPRRDSDLTEENALLRSELQETRDHAELLEFRILEFTEGIQSATSGIQSTCDQSTNTSFDDVITSAPISEDLSLPLSVDSGLELELNKSRISDYRRSLSKLQENSPEDSQEIAQISNLLDWVSSVCSLSTISSTQYDHLPHITHIPSSGSSIGTMSPRSPRSPRSPVQKKTGSMSPITSGSPGLEDQYIFEEPIFSESDLLTLATKFNESFSNPKKQEEALEEAVSKLRSVHDSFSRLQSRVNSLSVENKDLQEALNILHESHETRTEASGTESELVHGKTPSLHSDLSDSESDESSRTTNKQNIESTTSFQESGIFESSCEMVNTATQTLQALSSSLSNDLCPSQFSPCDQTILLDTNKDSIKTEVDLKTALARLTSIKNVVQGKELRNLRLQDLQESDEYLVAALEGEQVTLRKIEYDTIVATERNLQREIEILQYEKEQLASSLLEEKMENANREDKFEVLKAQVRLLEERLVTAQRLKEQFYDDKCEYEEAENDARLLSQRLESQLEAAREMESLLSASLSQEQEFCRELQRRVREMHEIDRDRRMHSEMIEKESRFSRRREEALMIANDSQKSQLTFALYGLILAQFWRRLACSNSNAIVPFSSFESNKYFIDATEFGRNNIFPVFPCTTECEKCLGYSGNTNNTRGFVDISDAYTQTYAVSEVSAVSYNMSSLSSLNSWQGLARIDEIENESLVDSEMEGGLDRRNQRRVNENGLSDREEYYLGQIEALQKERKALREDYENEQSILIEQIQNIKRELERYEQNLDESERDKCKLLFKLDEAQALLRESELQLESQAKQLKREFSQSVEVYQQEQKAMQDQYEERIVDLRRTIEFHEQKFSALLQQYSILQHELEPYFQSVSENIDVYNSEDGGANGRILTTKDLLSAVRELLRSESSTKQKLKVLEKKESAYRETINEADRIMSNHVTIYTRRIEELEAAIDQKSERIKQLEMSEERLRTTMKNNWKSGEGARITELLDRLIETENSELQLKERVWNLERNGKELQIKFAEAEKAQENLRSELRDQEELVQRLMTLTSDNNALTVQLQEAHEATRRASDIQQSENFLKTRVDELETSEGTLREALQKIETLRLQRERKFKDQVSNLEEEILSLRTQYESSTNECGELKANDSSLKNQLENYKSQVENLEKDLKESSSENICYETQYRSEVNKIRCQLKLANNQLTDLDTLNGELKNQLTEAQSAVKEVATQLEERSRRHENEVLSLNLELSQRDSRVEEFEAQLQQISHSRMAGELEYLAASPIGNLKNILDLFLKESQKCDSCSRSQSNHLHNLNDCLKTFNDLIHGRNNQSDSDSEEFDTASTENLGSNGTNPTTQISVKENHNDASSMDGETSVYSLTLTNDSSNGSTYDAVEFTTNPNDENPLKPLPTVPPRRRRDAKKKVRKTITLKTVKQEESLYNELEQSTVGNDSFYGSASVEVLEDLQDKVKELERVVAIKDDELKLADREASELHTRLMEEDQRLLSKEEEASKSGEELRSLRQQLQKTVQEYENVRIALESQHQVDFQLLAAKVQSLTEDVLRLTCKAKLKDKIIETLVQQIRSILRSGNTSVLVNQIRTISPNFTNGKEIVSAKATPLEVVDFDVDEVCHFLEEDHEQFHADPEATTRKSLDAISYQSLPSLSSPESAKLGKKSRSASDKDINKHRASNTASRNLPPLDSNKKSRIPRLRPLSGEQLPLKHDCPKREFSPTKTFSKGFSSVSSDPKREFSPKHPFSQAISRVSSVSSDHNNFQSKIPEHKTELKPLAKVIPKQRPMAKVTPKPKKPLEDSTSKFITDARKIKRMVTGLAPLNARIDCSAAPEFRTQVSPPDPSCVPRPVELRITRRVGLDGAVIAWGPLDHDCVAGFQVVVDGIVVQMVRSPHRTKALVTGLPFPNSFTICLVAVSEDGRCSVPALVTHHRTNNYKAKNSQSREMKFTSQNQTPRRAVPTCL